MKLVFIVGLLSLISFGIGCAKTESNSPSAAKSEEQAKKPNEDLQSLYARKDEFAAMKAPPKPQKRYVPGKSFIMFKVPGGDYEVVGWEKDASGKMTVCGFDKCNDRDIMWVKDRLPKEGKVNSVVKADCKAGKKLGDMSIAAIGTGPLYASVCDVTVIDLATGTTVATGQIVAEKYKTDASGKVDERSLIASADKKSQFVVPIKEMNDFLIGLS